MTREYWKKKIDSLKEEIRNTPVGETERIRTMCQRLEVLERAFREARS